MPARATPCGVAPTAPRGNPQLRVQLQGSAGGDGLLVESAGEDRLDDLEVAQQRRRLASRANAGPKREEPKVELDLSWAGPTRRTNRLHGCAHDRQCTVRRLAVRRSDQWLRLFANHGGRLSSTVVSSQSRFRCRICPA